MKTLLLIAMFPILFAANGLAEVGVPVELKSSCQGVEYGACQQVLYKDVKHKQCYFDQPPVNLGPIYKKDVKDMPSVTDETKVLIWR